MALEIFVDASAWIAVSDRRDKYHQAAGAFYRQLVSERRILVVTNLVIAEAYIVVRRSGGHAQAMNLLRSLRASSRLRKVCSDDRLEGLAEQLLVSRSQLDLSYADAVSFVVMQERQIEEAFTFDRHFAALGFRILPSQV